MPFRDAGLLLPVLDASEAKFLQVNVVDISYGNA